MGTTLVTALQLYHEHTAEPNLAAVRARDARRRTHSIYLANTSSATAGAAPMATLGPRPCMCYASGTTGEYLTHMNERDTRKLAYSGDADAPYTSCVSRAGGCSPCRSAKVPRYDLHSRQGAQQQQHEGNGEEEEGEEYVVGEGSCYLYTLPGIRGQVHSSLRRVPHLPPLVRSGGQGSSACTCACTGMENAVGAQPSSLGEDDMEESVAGIGSMDCADASTYFYKPESVYMRDESALYRHPGMAPYSAHAISAAYIRGQGRRSLTERWHCLSPLMQNRINEADVAATDASTSSHLLSASRDLHVDNDGGRAPMPASGEVPFWGYQYGVPAPGSTPSSKLAMEDGGSTAGGGSGEETFVSLVTALKRTCAARTHAPAVSWRAVEDITVFADSNSSELRHHYTYRFGLRQHLTHAALWDMCEGFAAGLRAVGAAPGDMLLLLEDTRVEWIVTLYAAWLNRLLVVSCPTDSRHCVEQIAKDAGADIKWVVCHHTAVRLVRQSLAKADGERRDVILEEQQQQPQLNKEADESRYDERVRNPSPSSSLQQQQTLFIVTRRLEVFETEEPSDVYDVCAQQETCTGSSTCGIGSSHSEVLHCSGRGLIGEKERREGTEKAEEHVLWWSDVLKHGEAKVRATNEKRDARQQQQQRTQARANMPIANAECVTSSGTTSLSGSPPPSLPLMTSCNSCCYPDAVRAVGMRTCMGETQEPLRATDLALVQYTEGSASRGVMLTHGALRAAVTAHVEQFEEMQLFPGLAVSSNAAGARPCEEAPPPMTGSTEVKGGDGVVATKAKGQKPHGWSLRGYSQSLWRWVFKRRSTTASDASAKQSDVDGCSQRAGPSYLAYLPLHRVQELVAQTAALHVGCSIYFASARTLTDDSAQPHGDLREYAPVLLPGTPYILARLCAAVELRTQTRGLSKLLYDVSYEARRQALRRGLDTSFLNSFAFAQPRQLLGGHCRVALLSGSEVPPLVREYLEVVCGVSVVQSYSLTEAAGCGTLQVYWGVSEGGAGGPLAPVEAKLRDVPSEMGESGVWVHRSARPRGELLLRGPTIMNGYYGQPEATAAALEAGGWLHTGDIAERRPDGSFCIVGRLKALAKNTRGTYIALEALEQLYAQHDLVVKRPAAESGLSGVCILVHPFKAYVCALVLTDEARTRRFIARHSAVNQEGPCEGAETGKELSGTSAVWPHCLGTKAFNEAVAASMATLGRRLGLQEHERISKVRVLYDTWTTGNGMRSPTGKLYRSRIHLRYAGVIKELFAHEEEDESWA